MPDIRSRSTPRVFRKLRLSATDIVLSSARTDWSSWMSTSGQSVIAPTALTPAPSHPSRLGVWLGHLSVLAATGILASFTTSVLPAPLIGLGVGLTAAIGCVSTLALSSIYRRRKLRSPILDADVDVLRKQGIGLLWSADRLGAAIYIEGWTELTGQTISAYKGTGWTQSVHAEDLPSVLAAVHQAVSAGEPFQKTFRLRTIDGHYRWHRSRAFPVRDSGEIVRWIGVTEDIHTEQEGLIDLLAERMRMSVALDAAGIGTWESDLQTGAVHMASLAYELWGLSKDTPMTRCELYAAVHPDDRDSLKEACAAAINSISGLQADFRVVRPSDNKTVWLSARGIVLRHPGTQTPTKIVGFFQDVTEAKEAISRQVLLNRELEHRAKNALAVAQSMLRMTPATDPATFVTTVEGRIEALAKSQSLLAKEGWQQASIKSLVSAVIESALAEGRAEALGAKVCIVGKMVQPLSMALHELATNAAKHGALSIPAGRVWVTWSVRRDGFLDLRWQETNGPRIVRPPTTQGFGSTLIELAVERHLGGQISREWAPSGLNLLISLPPNIVRRSGPRDDVKTSTHSTSARNSVSQPERPKSHTSSRQILAGKTILIAEDDALLAHEISTTLGAMGAKILGPASTVEAALALCSQSPDAAILDLQLATGDSLDVADVLGAQAIPFIFATGYSELPPHSANRHGGAPMLRKPISRGALIDNLQRLFSMQDSARPSVDSSPSPALRVSQIRSAQDRDP